MSSIYLRNMNLEQKYSEKSVEFLVRILEFPSEYTPEALQAAAAVLRSRNVMEATIKEVASNLLKTRLLDYFENFSVINDELTLPTSNILSREEVVPVFTQLFEEWKKENDDMIPDSWKYVIGAGFG